MELPLKTRQTFVLGLIVTDLRCPPEPSVEVRFDGSTHPLSHPWSYHHRTRGHERMKGPWGGEVVSNAEIRPTDYFVLRQISALIKCSRTYFQSSS
jgi:hypothetical protein